MPPETGLFIGDEPSLMVTSQFQYRKARDAFPCFDEPHLKATFSLSIGRHREELSCSNTDPLVLGLPMTSSQEYVWDHYKPTPVMSTYTLALMVSKYGFTEAFTKRGVRYRTWYAKEEVQKTQKLTENSVKIMDYLQETVFKDIPFPLEKMDQIIVPNHAAHGMENWGMMTLKLSELKPYLAQYPSTFITDKLLVHELAHQWHGNLVTCAWWNELWLNEGFASYWESVGLLALHSKDYVSQMRLINRQYEAFKQDDTMKLPMVIKENNETEAFLFGFNPYFYDRGASIVTMIADMLGQDAFLASVQNFLKTKSYSTAVTDDLWVALKDQAEMSPFFHHTNLTINEILDPWVKRPGYPIVAIIRNNSSKKVTARQSTVICKEQDECTMTQDENLWHIWVTYYSPVSGVSGSQLLLPMASQELAVPTAAKDEALVCNRGQKGYFRVRYDEGNLLKLKELLI